MIHFFALTPGGDTFKSFKRYLRYVFHTRITALKIDPKLSESTFITEFNRIITKVESKTNNVRHSIIFVDPELFNDHPNDTFSSVDQLNPLVSGYGMSQFLSMLILAFPEIHWIFMPGILNTSSEEKDIDEKFYCYNYDELSTFIAKVIKFNNNELIALFDPCNLRNRIKRTINDIEKKNLPIRNECAAAIDEEISYAALNAYTAYRFGYRAWIVPSLSIMKHVFKCNGTQNRCNIRLLFEDLYLNFPDKEGRLSNLKDKRDKDFARLKDADERILVTVGHHFETDEENINIWEKNLNYLKHTFPGKYKILYKPFSGIFDLWKKTGKWKWLTNEPKSEDNFLWPPRDFKKSQKNGSHSAPGRFLLIAEKLLDRSARILKNTLTVTDSIHAATLALEAKELLACQTPTKTLEAVALQHQAEVEAESMFYGVEYDFDIKSRIKDIKKEVKSISSWFHHSAKKRSQLNAEISILSSLAQKYRNHSQFDEENYCLHETRKLTNLLFVKRKPLGILVLPFRAYINFLLQSLGRFVFVIILWIFLFGTVYYSVGNSRPGMNVEFVDAIIVSAQTFLSFQPPGLEFWVRSAPFTPVRLIYFIFPAVLGFVHLGVFISHLTLILMRKPGG